MAKSEKIYVSMTDSFLSGWGNARGKRNKLIIECDTWQQAETIERNAKKRSEMKYVNVSSSRPRIASNVYPTWKTYNDMGEIWKK